MPPITSLSWLQLPCQNYHIIVGFCFCTRQCERNVSTNFIIKNFGFTAEMRTRGFVYDTSMGNRENFAKLQIRGFYAVILWGRQRLLYYAALYSVFMGRLSRDDETTTIIDEHSIILLLGFNEQLEAALWSHNFEGSNVTIWSYGYVDFTVCFLCISWRYWFRPALAGEL